MAEHAWVKGFPAEITVCDREGIVLELNDKAIEVFAEDGGEALLGTNLLDCHPGSARQMLEEMMAECRKNVYTIEKKGIKYLIYQAPWFKDGEYSGFIELALEIPLEMPHFVRD